MFTGVIRCDYWQSHSGFDEYLEATLDRISAIESLGRTRELTIKDLWVSYDWTSFSSQITDAFSNRMEESIALLLVMQRVPLRNWSISRLRKRKKIRMIKMIEDAKTRWSRSGSPAVCLLMSAGVVVNERSFVSTLNKLSTQHNMY